MGSILLETGSKRNGSEMASPERTGLLSPKHGSKRDPYQAVVVLLLAAVVLGTAQFCIMFSNPVLLDVAVTLGLSAGVLIGGEKIFLHFKKGILVSFGDSTVPEY